MDTEGNIITRSFEEIASIAKLSPLPIVVGGGVKFDDLASLAKTGVAGFFVVTAVSEADDPKLAAAQLVQDWTQEVYRNESTKNE